MLVIRAGIYKMLDKITDSMYGSELQISFWVNWVFMQPDYSQSAYLQNQLHIFIFLTKVFCGYK